MEEIIPSSLSTLLPMSFSTPRIFVSDPFLITFHYLSLIMKLEVSLPHLLL